MEQELVHFDLDDSFGPFVGITRLKRWLRAEYFELNPPREIFLWLSQHPDSLPAEE
jgi:hypothetical protein